jgi:Ser-tRNA(Ala) deacylase AlaX
MPEHTSDILPRQVAFQIPDLIRTKINLLPTGIEKVRVVEIEGLDLQADGGTHVKNTAEVGVFVWSIIRARVRSTSASISNSIDRLRKIWHR